MRAKADALSFIKALRDEFDVAPQPERAIPVQWDIAAHQKCPERLPTRVDGHEIFDWCIQSGAASEWSAAGGIAP
jgi:hypothetical protein